MKTKKDPQEAFNNYWNKYINQVIRRKIELVTSIHQPEIVKFRKKWRIPPAGFCSKRKYSKWYKSQLKKFKNDSQIVYQHNAEVLLETQGFNIKIPQSIFPKKSSIQTTKEGKGFFFYFRQRILELAYEIRLDSAWILPFEDYVLTNNLDMSKMPYTPVEIGEKIYYSHQNKEFGKKACLIFGPNTRLKDIALIWKPQIEPLLKTLPGYLSHPPRRKRNEKVTPKTS